MRKVIAHLSLSKQSSMRMIVYLSILFVSALIHFSLPEILRQATDTITNQDLSMLKWLAIVAIGATILYTIVEALNQVMHVSITNNYQEKLQLAVLEKYLNIKKQYLSRFRTGDIVTHIINNASDGVSSAIYYITNSFLGYTKIILSLMYMVYLEWRIALAIVIFNIGSRLFLRLFETKYRSVNKAAISTIKRNNSFMIDLLSNMLTIKVFNQGAYMSGKLKATETETMKMNTLRNAWGNGFGEVGWAIVKLCEFVVVYGFGAYLIYKGYTVIGTLIAFTFALDILSIGMNNVASALSHKGTALANIESVQEVLNVDPANTEVGHQTPLFKHPAITMHEVSFAYSEGQANILDQVSLTIREKDKVMITGKNGAGKSTLLHLLSGLYRPTTGSIYFGDTDTSNVHITHLANNYAFISQSSNIVEGSIYENLALSADYDQVLCDRILTKLNLEKITHLMPAQLSQGEKQRINIGRSLYKLEQANISIILADEIFSNVDNENTSAIAEVLSKEFAEKTVIMVCHEEIPFTFNKVIEVGQAQVMIRDLKAGARI